MTFKTKAFERFINVPLSIPAKIKFNALRPRQKAAISRTIFSDQNVWISIKSTLEFVPNGPINNIPPLVDNDLGSVRRQGIIWTNDGWSINAQMRASASMS